MNYQCKCGSTEMFIGQSGNNRGLYCSKCGKWIKWLNKNELKLFEHEQKEKEISKTISKNLKNIYKNANISIDNLDIVNNLNEFIDFLDKEIDRQLEREPLSVEDNISKCSYAHAYGKVKASLINIVDGRRYNEYDM